MHILSIDTSHQALSIAIMRDDDIIAELMTNTKGGHATRLMPAITNLMEQVQLQVEQLDEIVVAAGPGSYTATRIGMTTAKTLAWALDIPIYTVSSLQTLAYNGKLFNGYICPFFDARRNNVFTGLYKFVDGNLTTIEADRNQSMATWLETIQPLEEDVLFLSPHIAVFEEMIQEKIGTQAIIPEGIIHVTKASNLMTLSKQHEAIPVHEVAPNYLRITEAEANWLKQQEGDKQHGANAN